MVPVLLPWMCCRDLTPGPPGHVSRKEYPTVWVRLHLCEPFLQPEVDHKKLAGKLKALELSGLVDFSSEKAECVSDYILLPDAAFVMTPSDPG